MNVSFLPSKCLSITRLSINTFLLCQNMTRAEYFHIVEFEDRYETYNQNIVYCIFGIRNLAEDLGHMSKTHSLMESIKICRFKTFRVECFA